MACEHAPRQPGCLGDASAGFGFVLGDPTATQLPFMKGSGAARFSQQAEQQTVGGAHTVPAMPGEQAAERPGDGVVDVLLPGPEWIEAAQRAVGSGTDGVLGWFGMCRAEERRVGKERRSR